MHVLFLFVCCDPKGDWREATVRHVTRPWASLGVLVIGEFGQ